MQCEHAHEFISEYVTGEMDAALAVSLENHLGACMACRDTVADLRRLWSSLDEMPLVDPPESFHSTLMKRINEEEASTERAARPTMRIPAWRNIVHPRVFAYAAVMLVLLLSAELVQVQRAALGPLGWVLNTIHPAPLLRSHTVAWMPNGSGGGTLTVRLQAHSQANGALSRQRFHIQLLRKDGALPGGLKRVARDGELSSDQPTVLDIPLDFTPSADTDVLELTVTSDEAGGGEGRTVPIPLAPVQ